MRGPELAVRAVVNRTAPSCCFEATKAAARRAAAAKLHAMRPDARLSELERRLRATLDEVLRSAVDSGRASIEYDISGYGDHLVTPAREDALPFGVMLQQVDEISLFPKHPASRRSVTVDLWSSDADELFACFGSYLRAIVDGRVQLAIDLAGRGGLFRIWLDEGGDPVTHFYNVVFGFRAGKGKSWVTWNPASY